MSGGSNIQGRVISLEVTDSEGNDSDKCVIEVDDRNAELVLPRKGTEIAVAMGYREGPMAPMGIFKISEVRTGGYPRKVTINATSADMGGKLKEPRNEGYEKQTVGGIIGKVAGRHGLAPQVSPSLANKKHEYMAQTAQSDMRFATDLARQHGANMKISDGRMILARVGEIFGGMVTVTGDLANGADVVDYDAAALDRPAFAQAVGSWWDADEVEQKQQKSGGGSGRADLSLNHHYPNEEEAQDAAEGKAGEKSSEEGGVNLTIPGHPGIRAMMGLRVRGVRPGSADGLWVIKTATHRIDESGYTTKIDAGLPNKSAGGAGGAGG